MHSPEQPLNTLYNIFSEQPDFLPGELYCQRPDCSSIEGVPIQVYLYNALMLADTSFCQLISGQRKTGKTTELLQLSQTLTDEKNIVIFCSLQKLININDIHYVDILLAMLKILSEQLASYQIFIPYTDLGKVNLSDIKDIIPFKGLNFELKFSKVSDYIQYSEKLRKQVRELFDQQSYELYYAINTVLAQARKAIQLSGYKDIIFIVDDLDHCKPSNKKQYRQLDTFLIKHNRLLQQLDAKIILSVPFFKVMYKENFKLHHHWQTPSCVLYNFSVSPGTFATPEHKQDAAFLKSIIEKRLVLTGLNLSDAFTDSVLTMAIEASGGNPGQLFNIIRQCCILSQKLPVCENTLKNAIKNLHIDLYRSLTAEMFKALTGDLTDPETLNPALRRDLLANNYLLYTNDGPRVNPILNITSH
jgi:hypothetical protein